MNNGIKYVTLTDKELASLYKNKSIPNMDINQYVFVKDKTGEIIDKLRWNGKELVRLNYNCINSTRFGKIKPLNDEQYALFDLLQNESITVKSITGIAGSGKNYCAMTYAINAIEKWDKGKSSYKKIILIRNNIEVRNTPTLGALPSGINEKLLPFAMPVADLVGSTAELFQMINDNKIELLHLGFARGRSFENSIIVVDECENLTGEHVALLVSRVGKGSVILFLGDENQSDKVIFEKNSGLQRLQSKLFGNRLYGSVKLIKTERSKTAQLAQLLY